MVQGIQMIFFIFLIWLCSIALLVILETLFTNVVRESREIAEDSSGRLFWLGMVNGIFLLALIALIIFLGDNLKIPLFMLPGLLFIVVLIIGVLFGLTCMTQLIGERIFPDYSTIKRRSYAAGLTLLGCMTPVVGWYGLLPYLVFVGLGAYITRTYNHIRASRIKNSGGN